MKKGLKFILVLFVIIVVVVGGFFIALSIPKTAGVEYSDEDLQEYLANTGVVFHDNNASIEDIFSILSIKKHSREPNRDSARKVWMK